MRMELPRANGNSLNQTSVRMRVRFCMLSWFAKTSPNKPNARRDQVLAMLTPNQINSGTTRGSTPGLINPGLGEAGGRILLPEVREGSGTYQPTRRPKAHSQSHTQSVAGFEGSNQQGSYGGLPSQSSTPLPSQWSVLEGAGNSRRHEEYYDSRDNPFNDYPSRLVSRSHLIQAHRSFQLIEQPVTLVCSRRRSVDTSEWPEPQGTSSHAKLLPSVATFLCSFHRH